MDRCKSSLTVAKEQEMVAHIRIKKSLIENLFKYVEKQTGSRSLFRFLLERLIITLFCQMPTILGCVVRGVVYKFILGGIGSNCLIGKNVRFSVPKNIFLGNGVKIGEGCIIDARTLRSKIKIGDNVQLSRYTAVKAAEGDVEIGENVIVGPFSVLEGWGGLEIGKNAMISYHVVIMSIMYEFEDCSYPINQHPAKIGKITLGEDSWLGAHVVVLPGIEIGKGTVVGAGAVVTRNIPEYCVAVGVPAEVIRKRGEKL